MENITANDEKVLAMCAEFGAGTPERAECEWVYRHGKPVGYALRYFFSRIPQNVGERIIQALGGFGRIVKQLHGDEDVEVLEVSFKL